MYTFIKKPHIVFFLSIPVLLVLGILYKDATFDINVYDTYFVISYQNWVILVSLYFFTIGMLYRVLPQGNRTLSQSLTWIHIALTFGGALLVWVLTVLCGNDPMAYKLSNNVTTAITITVVLMGIGQLLFPINVLYAISREFKG
ncbi:MAG: hypothetical protein AAGA86_11385 [Bacteroidota bacterium]